jgi:hypothetical protein
MATEPLFKLSDRTGKCGGYLCQCKGVTGVHTEKHQWVCCDNCNHTQAVHAVREGAESTGVVVTSDDGDDEETEAPRARTPRRTAEPTVGEQAVDAIERLRDKLNNQEES